MTTATPFLKVHYDMPRGRAAWNGLMLVGEAPGKEEVEQGRPFVGRAGRLLNEALSEAGIDRERCIVANTFRFRPPKNKIGCFFVSKRRAVEQGLSYDEKLGKFGSVWCLTEYAGEIYALGELIDAWRPEIIVALGRTPFWALTGKGDLLANVGHFFNCRLVPGAVVMPTYHPSYILRGNWSNHPVWIGHLQGVLRIIDKDLA